MELNREKKISHISIVDVGSFDPSLSLGTILYGTVVTQGDNETSFVIEDIYYYKGISMKQYTTGEKLGYLEMFFSNSWSHSTFRFFLPFLWGIQSPIENELLQELETHRAEIPYTVHHLQLRKLNELSPYLNMNLYLRRFDIGQIAHKDEIKNTKNQVPSEQLISLEKDFSKPQYRFPTVFWVSADIQYDIYHLFAYNDKKKDKSVYYDIAYIQNIKVSKMMNSLFRKIRENENLDYIEESDDEDDFENIAADKYVDLQKMIPMEFVFHRKFKKWVPVRVVEKDTKIIHIHRL
jgi:hypothetical protein